MPSLSALTSGQRYLFYKNAPDSDPTTFRANFIDIIGTTLRISKYCENNVNTNSRMVTMPTFWITNVETLDEITRKQMLLLPEDILLMIDEYV